MLVRGRIDFYYADPIVTSYLIRKMGYAGQLAHLPLSHIIDQGSLVQMRFGLRRSYPNAKQVIEEIDTAIQKVMTQELHNKIIHRYI